MLGAWFIKGIIGKMERTWILKEICKQKYPFQHNNRLSKKGAVILTIIFIMAFFVISGCQKRQRVIIHVGASANEDSVLDGLEVINEDYDSAIKRCEERLLLIGEDDSGEAADIYSFMGGIYAGYTDDKEQAIFYLNKAMRIHERDGDDIGLAWDYSRMGKTYIKLDDERPEKGLEYLERAEALCNKYQEYGLDESILMATVWSSRGYLSEKKGEYEKALENYDKAQKIYEKKQQTDARVFWDKGHIYWDMGEYKLAEEEYLKAREIYDSNDDGYFKALIDSELGYLYLQMEEYDKSIEFYIEELEISIPENYDIEGQILAYANMAYAFCEMGDWENSMNNSIMACRMLEDNAFLEIDVAGACKANLALYYGEWEDKPTEEDFESWYKRVVLDGEDWR